MEQEYKDLAQAVPNDPTVRNTFVDCVDKMSFGGGWSVLKGCSEALYCCEGDLYSILFCTLQVEKDFSAVKTEKINS